MPCTPCTSQRHLLLVEDNTHDAEAFERALHHGGFPCDITRYARAEEALAHLRADPPAYDLVVVDHGLPGMSGLELCKALLHASPAWPVVIITGHGTEELAVEALKAGVADYIVKSASHGHCALLPIVLADVIRRYEDRRARARAEAELREAYATLEARVQQRTAEVEATKHQAELALEALRGSEARYRGLVDNAPLGVIACDGDGRILTINERILTMLSVGRAEPLSTLNLLHDPEMVESGVAARARHCLETGEQAAHEFTLDTGGDVPAEFRAYFAPLRDGEGSVVGVYAIVVDVTEQRQAVRLVRQSAAETRAIIAAAVDAIVTVDDAGIVLRWNAAAERMFGTPADEACGQLLSDLIIPEEYRHLHQQGLHRAQATGNAPLLGKAVEIVGQRKDGTQIPIELTVSEFVIAGHTKYLGIIRDISARKRAEAERTLLSTAVEQAGESIVITDRTGKIEYVNPAFERVTGYSRAEALGQNPRVLKSGHQDEAFYRVMWATLGKGDVWQGHFVNRRKDGTTYEEDAMITPVRDERGDIVRFVAVKRDVTEKLALEAGMRHAQKLEAVGALAAGIAHEINTPIQFVGDNTRFVADAFADVRALLRAYEELRDACGTNGTATGPVAEALARVAEAEEKADVAYLEEEIPRATEQTLDGVKRVAKIVGAMRSFSHPGGGEEKSAADLNEALDSTLTVARNELKYVADVETDFDPALPLVPCHLGDLNQVFLNLLINAAHAIAAAQEGDAAARGCITVRTRAEAGAVEITVSDTGTGIPEAARDRIFDPFFTTKEVGRGTGQGLNIAHTVVVKKHGGTLTFDTKMGVGTTFRIRLPLSAPAEAEAPAACGGPVTDQ